MSLARALVLTRTVPFNESKRISNVKGKQRINRVSRARIVIRASGDDSPTVNGASIDGVSPEPVAAAVEPTATPPAEGILARARRTASDATRRARKSFQGSGDSGRGDRGGGRKWFGGGGGGGGGGGDDESMSGEEPDRELSAEEARAWTRDSSDEVYAAVDGAMLFAGLFVAFLVAPLAFAVFHMIRPNKAQREQFEYEQRTEAWRRKREREEAKEMEAVRKAREVTGIEVKSVEEIATSDDSDEEVEDDPVDENEQEEVIAAKTEEVRGSPQDDAEVESADEIVDADAAVASPVKLSPVSERQSEISEAEPEESTSAFDDKEETIETVRALDDTEVKLVRRYHQSDEEYLPTSPDNPHHKLVQAIREANHIVRQTHERKVECEQEFKDALRYRQQIVHILADRGIPVAPLVEIKETFGQSEKTPISAVAKKKLNDAFKHGAQQGVRFVRFASPHVKHASQKAFEFGKNYTKVAHDKFKDAQARGDIRIPDIGEATAKVQSVGRKALGAVVKAYDALGFGQNHDDGSKTDNPKPKSRAA